MSTSNLPINVFKMATVRAPRKPLAEDAAARWIPYGLNSAFYNTLKTDRAGANPRSAMMASANTFKSSNALHIASLSVLRGLFPGFERIDDYLRAQQKSAVKADLKALVESPAVLNQTAAAYVAGGGVRRPEIPCMGQCIRAHRAWREHGVTHRGGTHHPVAQRG